MPQQAEVERGTGSDSVHRRLDLFKKYYGAAQHVADHALLTTSGLQFAPYPVITFTDRQKYYEEDILQFYEQHKVDYEA
jgi:hypothetical protein